MTELEWLECTSVERMLAFLHDTVSERKLRLFACACFRRIWRLLLDQRSRDMVEAMERFADGQATPEEFAKAGRVALSAADYAEDAVRHADASYSNNPATASIYTAVQASYTATYSVCYVVQDVSLVDDSVSSAASAVALEVECAAYQKDPECDWAAYDAGEIARASEGAVQASVLRDIVGNPFCPVVAEGAWFHWNNSTIVRLAQTIYDERAFDQLPILADALEDAGCTSVDVLHHCRQSGPHVRGCWVLDLLLEKE